MDSRLESIESLALLEGDFSKLKTDNDTIYSKLCSIETLLQILTRGKSIVDEGEVSTQLNPSRESYHPSTLTSPTFFSLSFLTLPPKTLEIPGFNGIDSIGWLARTEQYFELNGTQLEFKVMMALVCMEESALYWLRWLRHRHPNLT